MIPVVDSKSENFNEELAFNIWSTHSCSDYRNDRERPYNGQPWTDGGSRGKTKVKGLTMRDIKDCFIKAFLLSCPDKEYIAADVFLKCWDFSVDPAIPTQYLLDKQKEGRFVSTKVETGNWRPQDVYLIKEEPDPIAISQNMMCEVEKMMGIYPNINIVECDKETEILTKE